VLSKIKSCVLLFLLLVSVNAVSAVYQESLNQGLHIEKTLSALSISAPALPTITWVLLVTTLGGLAFIKRHNINAL
jgi:hypothetical protein